MLGVHRPTVTIAAAMLQKAGLASCSCHRIISEEYDLLGG
jgi:Mn-dependent DtxR family transcriptional regulator